MQERMTALESNCKIELVNVTKRFGKVIANDSVNLTIEGGKVLCLLGENGSGKTTLMNVLSGIYMPEQGHILKNGVEIQIRSPKDAFANGIGMIHQHFKLVDVLTVTENIILGLNEKDKLNIRAAAQKIDDICKKYGFDLDPMAKIYDLSVSQKQTVEIVKVLFRGAEILILDEPTAVLTPQETDRLFQVVRNMRADGKAIVLITHKLHEVLSVSDEVAVLRKGKYIGTVHTADTDPQKLTEMMVGRAVSLNIDRLTAWPTIISVSFWGSVSAVFTVPMYLPLRSTATLSEMAMTSWSLWVMMTMALPSAFMARRMSKSRSVSWGVSTAVGSSRMRMSAPR